MDPFGSKPPLDPENEILRNNVESDGHGRPNLEVEIIPRMVGKTSRIHAGYLFDPDGKEVLKQLCLRLCSTSASIHYEGWKGFGINLGLSSTDIEYIANHNNRHDEAYTVLQVFVQDRDSTLDKIILALKNINRLDIITKVGELLEELSDSVVRRQNTVDDNDSGYYGSTEEPEIQGIIMPPFVPEVPHALQKFRTAVDVSRSIVFTSVTREYAASVENESLQMNARISKKENVKKIRTEKKKYKKTVMLTFANDGIEEAKEVAEIFRSETENHDRIGVVILNDHTALVNSNPDDFICSAFDQVDYVVPIVTKGYLKAISPSNSEHEENSLFSLDPKYSKYIYTLMSVNYLHDGCKNRKVRCIIPDKLVHLTYQHPMLRATPLFQSWIKQSETEYLKERIINSKI